MKEVELRPYQKECIELIQKQKPGRYLISMATGLGKTVTFANIPRQGRMLILSHRQELVFQPKSYFDCSYGVEMGCFKSHGEEVVSASVMSLVRRLDRFKRDDFDIIVVDECHHVMAPSYRKILNYFKARLVLGFTATANRADHQMLGEVFEKVIFHRDLKWGIENGYLSPIECYRVDVGLDTSKLGFTNGDFNIHKLAKAMDTPQRNKIVSQAYQDYANGQTLIFCAGIKHAYHLAKEIPDSQVVTAQTPNRQQIIKDFSDRKFKCLINCMVFTEGTDLPLIETVIIARPTASQSLYTQMIGRGLRLCEGKEKTVIIDCVGEKGNHNICEAPHLFNQEGLSVEFMNSDDAIEKEKEGGNEIPFLIPELNVSIYGIDLFTEEDDDEANYIWFLTVKHKKSNQIVTKILYTDDIDNAVYTIRKHGFSFISCVGVGNAYRIADKKKKNMKGILRNHSLAGIKLSPSDFYTGLLAILDEGLFNDNITIEMIEEYARKSEKNEESEEEEMEES